MPPANRCLLFSVYSERKRDVFKEIFWSEFQLRYKLSLKVNTILMLLQIN